jgi:hypothetical protein
MPFRDILKKKEKVEEIPQHVPSPPDEPSEFQFTFMRSDTHTQEIISPPTFSSTESSSPPPSDGAGDRQSRTSRLFGRPRTKSTASAASASSRTSESTTKSQPKSPGHKRLSQRLHLSRNESSSSNVPEDLPDITPIEDLSDITGVESQWEARATRLARKNEMERSRPSTPTPGTSSADLREFKELSMSGGKEKWVVSSKYVDDNIQEAIRLHEAGELETATAMFGRLADPQGENNALSQVLYGLALRYVQFSISLLQCNLEPP